MYRHTGTAEIDRETLPISPCNSRSTNGWSRGPDSPRVCVPPGFPGAGGFLWTIQVYPGVPRSHPGDSPGLRFHSDSISVPTHPPYLRHLEGTREFRSIILAWEDLCPITKGDLDRRVVVAYDNRETHGQDDSLSYREQAIRPEANGKI
jgi:hypothetical protein